MDPIVMQAMAKWPNVPHCYGWLALDARGNWRMRDEQAQAENLPGDRIANEALLAFIHRNYGCDERGCWYFQNGPQRVYVTLKFTPFIARTDPKNGFMLHTGALLKDVDAAWMTPAGELLLVGAGIPAAVDDRDIAHCLALLRIGDKVLSDDALVEWLAAADTAGAPAIALEMESRRIPIGRINRADIAHKFGFVTDPQP